MLACRVRPPAQRLVIGALFASAGCRPEVPPVTGIYLPHGCPGGVEVAIAGPSGWLYPMRAVPTKSAASHPAYAHIGDREAVTINGLWGHTWEAWLVTGTRPPCKAELGPYYVTAVTDGTPHLSYGLEVGGCPPPTADEHDATALLLGGSERPKQCAITAPRRVAERVGSTSADGAWSPPTAEVALPPVVESVVPRRECRAPSCERLFTVDVVDVESVAVAFGVVVNWVTRDAAAACAWRTESWRGLFVPRDDGTLEQLREEPGWGTSIVALLSDATGLRTLVTRGPGHATVRRIDKRFRPDENVWQLVPDERAAFDRLGPRCR